MSGYEKEYMTVDQDLLNRILIPYKDHCKYLKKAYFKIGNDDRVSEDKGKAKPNYIITSRGEFGIPESCYIADTGHFNAVEFNICYNQLGYVSIAQCILEKLSNATKDITLEEYIRRQLSDVLIVNFSSSFKRAIDSSSFYGSFTITKIVMKQRKIFLKTHCDFFDDSNGFAAGEQLLAITGNF